MAPENCFMEYEKKERKNVYWEKMLKRTKPI